MSHLLCQTGDLSACTVLLTEIQSNTKIFLKESEFLHSIWSCVVVVWLSTDVNMQHRVVKQDWFTTRLDAGCRKTGQKRGHSPTSIHKPLGWMTLVNVQALSAYILCVSGSSTYCSFSVVSSLTEFPTCLFCCYLVVFWALVLPDRLLFEVVHLSGGPGTSGD